MRRRLVAALALAPMVLLAGCGSSRTGADRTDEVPAKICGLFDRDRIVALGLPEQDIAGRGEVVDQAERRAKPLTCRVVDRRSGRAVVYVRVTELDLSEADDATRGLRDEYADRRRESDQVCSRPDALNSVGSGYACRGGGLVRVAAVVPGRLVRITYRPLRTEPPATEYARAIGLIGNLQENVVAFDQGNPSVSPSPSS